MRHVWSGTAVADPTERERVIEAAHLILRHTPRRALTNPAYIALIVLLAVARVGGVDLVRVVAVGVAVTLAVPLVSSGLARRAERSLEANGESPQQSPAT